MSPQVLIDTSIWVEYFRGKDQELVESVKNLIRTRRATLCGIVLSELLAGVRTKKIRDILKQTLDALEYVEVSRDTWTSAGELSDSLRRQGISVPLTDLILAALALENNVELFTLDSHFRRIAEIKQFKSVKA
ncbi:MAG: PIN domain-containing protein [Chloroflexi bacterium]|nr:PIN domain-containing protein [Chloroflexota bacterium]